jgi:hypothetical protein
LDQPEIEARAPAQAPQTADVVEQAEAEASLRGPILEPPAASPESVIKLTPDEARAADPLLAFTCCWPDLPTAVSVPQPAGGIPAASLAADPAAAWTLRDVVKEAQAAACDRFRLVIRVILVALVASRGPPRRAQCERRAQAPHAGRRCHQLTHQCSTPNQTGPHRRDYSASCSAQSPTGLADRGFLPQLCQSWRLASDEVPAD